MPIKQIHVQCCHLFNPSRCVIEQTAEFNLLKFVALELELHQETVSDASQLNVFLTVFNSQEQSLSLQAIINSSTKAVP
jgi:hypothetical protein